MSIILTILLSVSLVGYLIAIITTLQKERPTREIRVLPNHIAYHTIENAVAHQDYDSLDLLSRKIDLKAGTAVLIVRGTQDELEDLDQWLKSDSLKLFTTISIKEYQL